MRLLNLIRNTKNWYCYLPVKVGIARGDPLVFRTRGGLTVVVPKRLQHTFKELFMAQAYDHPRSRILPASPVIFDVGANAGYFSLFMANRYPAARILALEPIPANFELLQHHAALNPGHLITPINKALSGDGRPVTLRYNAADSFTTAASVFENPYGNDTLEVESVTLAQVMAHHEFQRIDLLKLDCEGSEYDILYNLPAETLASIDRIALEHHPGPEERHHGEALAEHLKSCGYGVELSGSQMLFAWRERTVAMSKSHCCDASWPRPK